MQKNLSRILVVFLVLLVSACKTKDTDGPSVNILNASRDTGIITGYVDDASNIQSFTMDGVNVALDSDNHFSTTFTDQPFNTFVAVDESLNETNVQYARRDQEFIPGISARLNSGGISFLGDALATALGTIDFDAATESLNPVIGLNVFGLFSADLSLQNFGFDEPGIVLEVLENERLDTDVDIPNFSIGISVSGNALFIPFSMGGTVYVDNVEFDSELVMDIVNKDLAVGMANTDIYLDGFAIDFDGIPNILGIETIIGHILGGVTNFLLPFFGDILEAAILPIASEFIGEIPINLQITTVENETLRVKALPTYLDTFDGGLTIDLGATVTAPFPSAVATPTLGSLYSVGETPTIGNKTPAGKDFDVGAAISANMINQALFAAHEAGITTMQLRPENTPGTDPQGLSVIQTAEDDIQGGDLIGMSILPASPPFITLKDSGSAKGNLGWHDVTLEFDMKRAGWSEYDNIFSVTFNLDVAFELGATDDGFLQIGIEELPDIEVLAISNSGLIQIGPFFANAILDVFMPVVMPTIASRLKSIPLPRIAGYSIHPQDFWITGSGKNNLALAGNLVKVSTTEAAEAPTTLLSFADTASRSSIASVTASATDLSVVNGEVSIGISGINPGNDTLEYRFRVDSGAWSIWKPRTSLSLSRLLGGDHIVEVCSRTVILKQEQDCPTVSFNTAVL